MAQAPIDEKEPYRRASEDVAADWRTIIGELDAYGGALAEKPRVTALNKVDALSDELRADRRAALAAVAGPVMMMSGASREGVDDVLRVLRRTIDDARTADREDAVGAGPWRP